MRAHWPPWTKHRRHIESFVGCDLLVVGVQQRRASRTTYRWSANHHLLFPTTTRVLKQTAVVHPAGKVVSLLYCTVEPPSLEFNRRYGLIYRYCTLHAEDKSLLVQFQYAPWTMSPKVRVIVSFSPALTDAPSSLTTTVGKDSIPEHGQWAHTLVFSHPDVGDNRLNIRDRES